MLLYEYIVERREDIMIRRLQRTDIENVADIWLETNIKAHDFISEQYWRGNFDAVKEMITQAEVYIYEDESGIQGFIGLNGDHIEGIFVRRKVQSTGIGRQLLDFVKKRKQKMSLTVYQKNTRAIKFYQREKFCIQSEGLDEDTGEREYVMKWMG